MHIVIVVLAVFTGLVNVSGSNVRAEGFGERSVLFSLVSDQLAPTLEEVTAEDVIESRAAREENYFGSSLVTSGTNIDYHTIGDPYVTTTVGGSVIAPLITESKPSVAARTDIDTHIVSSGDTIGGIAEKYGLSVNTILWANGLSFRSILKIGQPLSIPPVDGVIHKVKSGETLSRIASKYNADVENILAQNKLASADDLRIGEELIIPGGSVTIAPRRSSIAPVRNLFTGTPPAATKALPAGSGRWVWPSDLRYLTQYYGWRHTGIDIDCDGHAYSTNSNYAAADGVIVYSGWNGGYGLSVVIDHGNGIKTRYGHNSQNYVSVGQVVTAGTPIGHCGNTGRSTGTHLHFEVIVGDRFRNPLEYLR